MTLAFTGTRRGMTTEQRVAVASLLYTLKPTKVLHGAAVGSDRTFHELTKGCLRELYPCDAEQTEWAYANVGPGDLVHDPPDGVPWAVYALKRNRIMVNLGEATIATPAQVEEQPRSSGTWATIRYAKQDGFPLYACWPDGRVTTYNSMELPDAQQVR